MASQIFDRRTVGIPGTVTPDVIGARDDAVEASGRAESYSAAALASADAATGAKNDAIAAKDAAQAVGATNDAIMAGVAAGLSSAFSGQILRRIQDFLDTWSPPLAEEPVEDWVHWGDSLTHAGSSGAWVTKFSKFTRRNHYNGGVGGQTAEQVSVRMFDPSADQYRDRKFTIAVGRNGFKYTEPAAIAGTVQAMVKHISRAKRGLILDVPPWDDEPLGSPMRSKLEILNSLLKNRFGEYFYPAFSLLRTGEAAVAAGIVFTDEDKANIVAGITPKSFRSDGGHLNDSGGKALEFFIRKQALVRGYVKEKLLPAAHDVGVGGYSRRYVASLWDEDGATSVSRINDHASVDDLLGVGYSVESDGTRKYLKPANSGASLTGEVPVETSHTLAMVVSADASSKGMDFLDIGGRRYRRATNGAWQAKGNQKQIVTAIAPDGWRVVVATYNGDEATLDVSGIAPMSGVVEYDNLSKKTWLYGRNTLDPKVAEVIVWPRVLSASEVVTVRQHLAQAHGLTLP